MSTGRTFVPVTARRAVRTPSCQLTGGHVHFVPAAATAPAAMTMPDVVAMTSSARTRFFTDLLLHEGRERASVDDAWQATRSGALRGDADDAK